MRAELAAMAAARDRAVADPAAIADLAAELREVHEGLRATASRLRDCEAAGDFGAEFVALARAQHRDGERREAIRRRIDERLGAAGIDGGLPPGSGVAGPPEPDSPA